eukprot:1799198-Rhodomonas_salina.2
MGGGCAGSVGRPFGSIFSTVYTRCPSGCLQYRSLIPGRRRGKGRPCFVEWHATLVLKPVGERTAPADHCARLVLPAREQYWHEAAHSEKERERPDAQRTCAPSSSFPKTFHKEITRSLCGIRLGILADTGAQGKDEAALCGENTTELAFVGFARRKKGWLVINTLAR